MRRAEERRRELLFESRVLVHFDDDGISVRFPDGGVQSIAWGEILRVAIETNDSGPWGADVWCCFEGAGTRCVYPQGATGEMDLLAALPNRFPGFDQRAVIKAMGSTSNARFLCWAREAR